MGKRIQLPAIGGIRKSIIPGGNTAVGTTIKEFGSNTVTLAQLKNALGIASVPTGGGLIGDTNSASISVGAGLAGGGALIGNVPISLIAPIPFFPDDQEAPMAIPGPQGLQGPPGPPGPSVFIPADENDDVLFVLVKL